MDTASVEEWIIDFTNLERIKAGLRPFDHDPAISDIARAHSEQMTLHGYGHVVSARSLSEKQCSKRYTSLVECKDANYSTTKSILL